MMKKILPLLFASLLTFPGCIDGERYEEQRVVAVKQRNLDWVKNRTKVMILQDINQDKINDTITLIERNGYEVVDIQMAMYKYMEYVLIRYKKHE